MFFNVDTSKEAYNAFNFGSSNMMSSTSLQRAMRQQNPAFKIDPSSSVMTFDVETTGVFNESQVRQFAYRIDKSGEEVVEFSANFINEQMDIASVSKSGMSTRMSTFVAEAESGGRAISEMGEQGGNFVASAKSLFNEMLNVDHVSGHNVLFDINKMSSTLNALDAFHMDEEAVRLHSQVMERINTKQDFLVDTAETMRGYFKRKASDVIGESGDRASRIVSQTLGPEMLASIGIGGSTAPVSVENITLNTNLLNLLETDSSPEAKKIIEKITKASGSHVADFDVAIQASMEKYRQSGQLDFRFNPVDGKEIGDPISEFEQYARNKILKSQAMVPTRDIASVMHASDATRSFLTSDEGIRGATLTASGSDLGLSGAQGYLKFDKGSEQFRFHQFGSLDSMDVDQDIATRYIRDTYQQAFSQGPGTESTIRVGSTTARVTRNIFDEKILSTGINFIQTSKFDRINQTNMAVRSAGLATPVDLADPDTLMRSLGMTSEQFAETQSVGNMLKRIGNAFRGISASNELRPATSLSDEVNSSYMANIKRVGLPFTSIDVVDRVTSVGLAQVTADIGEAAGMNLTHARNAKLTSEMGLSYAKMTSALNLGKIKPDGDLVPSSRIIAPFESLFEYSDVRSTVGGVEQVQSQTLRVKAFSQTNEQRIAAGVTDNLLTDNIINSDLNRLTLSFVQGSENVSPRVNLDFGAIGHLSKNESRSLADIMMGNLDQFRETLGSLDTADESLKSSISQAITMSNQFSSETDEVRQRVTAQLADHIKDRGIVVGNLAEGEEKVSQINRLFRNQGVDITSNDVRLNNFGMRMVHADNKTGVVTMSAMSDLAVDLMSGRTSQLAQEESLDALNRTIKVESQLDDATNKRIAARTVLEAQNSSRTEEAIAVGSRRIQNQIATPMTDFYLKNKPKIGFAALGIAVAGVGYYMAKKNRESDLYNETMEAQPTAPNMGRSYTPQQESMVQSTRRDPLVTAGVVGNLDRNKIGHTQMGPNKYNHLYGG